MANVNYVEAVFTNGDKLVLILRTSTFAGFKPKALFELFYAEYAGASYDVYHTEYFPATEFSKAMYAFNIRMTCGNPMQECNHGYPLDALLEKKDPEYSF
jgi:hypothetical protein